MFNNDEQDVVGREPRVFTGDKPQAESFASQWQIFDELNFAQSCTLYQRAMIFLSYIQGPLVNEWVHFQINWLQRSMQEGWSPNDRHILCRITREFNREYTDTLRKERPRATLRRGIMMFGWDVDEYISTFESLVRHAEYDTGESLTVDIFTDGILLDLYEVCYNIDNPTTYEEWKDLLLKRVEQQMHMQAAMRQLSNDHRSPSPMPSLVYEEESEDEEMPAEALEYEDTTRVPPDEARDIYI